MATCYYEKIVSYRKTFEIRKKNKDFSSRR
ncbi:hypothetical protein [Carnobacterium sp. FSL E2-0243]